LSDDPPVISYEVKEVLGRIEGSIKDLGHDMNGRLDRIENQLAQKADRAEVVALDGRVKVLEVDKAQRDKAREVSSEHRKTAAAARRWKWGTGIALFAAAAATAEAIITGIH
jgi:hypothetical protein